MRLVPKGEALSNPYARRMMEKDHIGRYNEHDSTMVALLFKVSYYS